MELWIPYGETEVQVGVRTENLARIAEPKDVEPLSDLRSKLHQAVSTPMKLEPLSQIVRRDDRVTILTDLQSNSTSFDIINSIIFELSSIIDVETLTVLWKQDESFQGLKTNLEGVNGKSIKTIDFVDSAIPLYYKDAVEEKETMVRKLFSDATIKVLISRICFDPIWGHAGGRTPLFSLLDKKTRNELRHEAVKSYIEKVSFDINDALRITDPLASVNDRIFSINIVTGKNGNIIKIFTGDVDVTYAESVKFVDEVYNIGLEKSADILIVGAGGRPYDYTLMRSLDSVLLNKSILKKDGNIILVGECIGGYGDENFKELFSQGQDLKKLKAMLKKDLTRGLEKTYFLTELLEEFRFYLVSVMPDYYAKTVFKLKTSRTINDALQSAFRIVGKDSSVAVVPYGSFTRTLIKPRIQDNLNCQNI